MKIGAIKKACMDARRFIILDTPNGTQWITNGAAAWPVEGIGIDKDGIPALFDIEEKKVAKLVIDQRVLFDPCFSLTPISGETAMKDMGAVWYLGDLYRVIQGEGGIEFINVAYLKPAENKDGFMEFRQRGKMVACYGNMFVAAIVLPEGQEKAEAIMGQLHAIVEIGVCADVSGGAGIGTDGEEPDDDPDDEPDGQMRMDTE